jgi:hypothetical protein
LADGGQLRRFGHRLWLACLEFLWKRQLNSRVKMCYCPGFTSVEL